MPLHEYLEQKRRQNINVLNASGACHICGSTCRNSRGFHHFLDNEKTGEAEGGGSYSSENSLVPRPNLAAMRTCACFGQSPSDPDYWPYSLRVCDKCIEDDAGIGRIRSCGICGMVACDENCGAELLECTDCAEWNNAGCLECRKKGDFSEIEIFRRSMGNRGRHPGRAGTICGEPRVTRICAKCLDMSTPWVKYDFVCRRFRCETRLVPSDIAERKRFCTFGSSPLNLLPGDSLVAVVDFLSGSDLKQLFLTCSAMCTVAERVAKEKVERVNDQYPTGPIVISKRKDGFGQVKNWTHFEGKNDFSLRAPDDEKAWVGVYHYLEKITKEMFYFGFQTTGQNADKDVVERFINRRGRENAENFTFDHVYSKVENDYVTCQTVDVSMRGGCVLFTGENASPTPLTVASSELPASGTHRVICRLFCPGSGGARGNREANNSYRLGTIGLLRTHQRNPTGEGPRNAWAQRADVMEGWLKEDVVVGMEYDAVGRSLVVHSNSHVSRASRFASSRYAVAEAPGDLRVAVELTAKAAKVAQTILTVREVDAEEWAKFVDHTTEGVAVGAAERVAVGNAAAQADMMFDPMDAMEAMEVAADDVDDAVMRFEMRNRRREREIPADGDDEGTFQRVQARAMEEGRRVARVLLPRRERARDADGQAPVAAAGAARIPVWLQRAEAPPADARRAGRDPRTRRVVRALRPFARAAAAAEEMLGDGVEAAERPRPWREALAEVGDDDVAPPGFDAGLVDMDEEVAAGEFVRQIEIQQVWRPAEEPEPQGRLSAVRREGNAVENNAEGNDANGA